MPPVFPAHWQSAQVGFIYILQILTSRGLQRFLALALQKNVYF